jgi:iron complex outermembrane recepter protein
MIIRMIAALLQLILAIILLADSSFALGAPEKYRFDIREQAAQKALNALAEQANVPMLFVVDDVKGVTTRELKGELTLKEAVDRLLAGTGLIAGINSSGVLTITSPRNRTPESKESQAAPGKAPVSRGGAVLTTSSVIEDHEASRNMIEEIVVTATYRDTNLMDTPISMSAVDADTLERLGAADLDGIFRFVPGLNLVSLGTSNNRLVVRGISSQTGEATFAVVGETVATYIDDTPVTSAAGAARAFTGSLFDMDRIEVLKGPQGTLFGEASQGGTIRYIYNKPDREALDYKIKAGFSTQDESDDSSYGTDGMVNMPLGENFAVRLAAFTDDQAGWIDKINVTPIEEDINSYKSTGGRLAARWWVNDQLTIQGSIFDVDIETEGSVVSQSTPYVDDQNGRLPGVIPFSRQQFTLFNLRFDYEFASATFTSTTSYYEREVNQIIEFPAPVSLFFDGLVGTFLNPPIGMPGSGEAGPIPCNPGVQDAFLSNPAACPYGDGGSLAGFASVVNIDTERLVHEFRLVSNDDGPLLWTAGIFYKSNEEDINAFQMVGMQPGREFLEPIFAALFQDPSNIHVDEQDELSVYGEATYLITDHWDITAGVRFSQIEQDFSAFPEGTDDDVTSPKLNIAWHPFDNQLYYFNYATGFRPGNINNPQLTNVRVFTANGFPQETIDRAASHVTYESDEVESYELGAKLSLADGQVQIAAALYYMDWNDMIQLSFDTLIPGVIQDFNDNIGAAHSEGFELEINWQPTDGLNLRLAGDMNEAETDEDNPGQGGPTSGLPKGSKLVYSPEWSLAASIDYTVAFGGSFEGRFRLDYQRIDEQFFNVTTGPIAIEGYDTSSFRFTLSDTSDPRWKAALFVQNLANADDVTNSFRPFGPPGDHIRLRPRQVGLEITWQAR